jgi:hypothetical protein
VVVEVHLLDLRLLLLRALPLLELLVRGQPADHPLAAGVLLLDLVDQLLQLQVPRQLLAVVGHAAGEFFAFGPHLLCQFEHAFLVAGVGVAVRGGLAVLLGDILVALLELVDLAGQRSDVIVLLPDEFLQRQQFFLL